VDINATIVGQMITFAIFVWFTMKFVWPLLEAALKERQQKIADGLAAAERGHKELEISQKYAIQHIHEARSKAIETLEYAKKQAALIIEQAKFDANEERTKILALGQEALEEEKLKARETLQSELIQLTIVSTEKLLGRVINDHDQQVLLEDNFVQLMTANKKG
jgi:F-type H+-transporting ATPase subunit b